MKTNVFFKAMVMVAVVMASVLNVNAINPTDFFKNDEMNNELVSATTIFMSEEGYLFRHLRYTYTYDNENRVIAKEASKWNSIEEAWVPYFKLDVTYTDGEIALDYARWNTKSGAYDSHMEKAVYELNHDGATLLLASAE